MPAATLEGQLVKYLTDAHSIEEQALAQMRSAPDLAEDERLATAFKEHEAETERHERLVRERLEGHDAKPSRLEGAGMGGGGQGLVVFARPPPATPRQPATHPSPYQHP